MVAELDQSQFGREMAEIRRQADEVVLGKEQLTTNDVREFLEAEVKIAGVVNEAVVVLDLDDEGMFGMGILKLHKALANWDKGDRSLALLHLLHFAVTHSQYGKLDTAEACARCCLALVEEPLVLDRNPKTYQLLFGASGPIPNEQVGMTVKAYRAGILYNVARFCPEACEDEVTEESIKLTRKTFSGWLDVIQGRTLNQRQ